MSLTGEIDKSLSTVYCTTKHQPGGEKIKLETINLR